MKIVCVASSAIGHIDFGGGGFLRLADALRKDGCDIHWLSYGDQVDRLNAKFGNAEAAPEIANLALRPFFEKDSIAQFENTHRARVNAMQRLLDRLRDLEPDFILFDRLLAHSGLVAEQLGAPYAAVGTSGGVWRFEEQGAAINVHPAPEPVDAYVAYGEALKDDLGWRDGNVDSAWLRSPHLNICFVPRVFYPGGDKTAAYVHHHTPPPANTGEPRLAISFGNQGAQDRLRGFLNRVVHEGAAPFPIGVFAGANEALAQDLRGAFGEKQINVHGWVDFSDHLQNVGCMAFLGGVGTIWRCINNGVPMIIVPGLIGDQLENGRRVDELGIGYCLEGQEDPSDAIAACFNDDRLHARINALRATDAYSDTLESVCGRIRAIAAR